MVMHKVFMGYDARDNLAIRVAMRSMLKRSRKVSIKTTQLMDWKLRHAGLYWRHYLVDRDGQRHDGVDGKPFSTDFSFTRFLVPELCGHADEWVLFCDPDVMFRSSVGELFEFAKDADPKTAVYCVKHNHAPPETSKMAGLMQTRYHRKNWSSVMLMNPARCSGLTKYVVNNWTGAHLHAMLWVEDDQIAELPEEWNWLCGHSSPDLDPKLVHYTMGTPDLPGYEDAPFADEWREYANELLM